MATMKKVERDAKKRIAKAKQGLTMTVGQAKAAALVRYIEESVRPFNFEECLDEYLEPNWDVWDRPLRELERGVYWFGAGQVIEVNGSVFTYLQPSRSHSSVLGVVFYQYF